MSRISAGVRAYLYTLLTLMVVQGHALAADIVVAKGAGKIAVDLSGLSAGVDPASREYVNVLQASLARSGWLAPARSDASDYMVDGSLQNRGSVLDIRLRLAQKTSRRILFEKSYSGDGANGVRRAARASSDDIVEAITGRRGFASAKLVMVGSRTGSKELYICDSDGQGLQPVTGDKTTSLSPRWGHDGRSIFYTSFLRKFPAIYRIDLDSRGRSRISNYSGLNTGGAVSPDGRSMALILSKDGNPELYVMRLGDGALTRLTSTPRSVEASPTWSPDGRELVYVSDQTGTPQLFIVSHTGGPARQLTTRGRQNVAPDWGPGGQIAFSSLIGGKFQVCLVDPGTGQIRQLTSDHADHEDPSWAPDGRHIACARSVNYRSQVYLIDTMGDPSILLTDYQGDWFSPEWSP